MKPPTNQTLLFSIIVLLLTPFLVSCFGSSSSADDELSALFEEIDNEIEHSSIYQAEKEKRLTLLRDELNVTSDNLRRMELAGKLIDEYEAYISDSAIYYINMNLQNPLVTENQRLYDALQIRKADVLSHAGLFSAAEAVLATLNSATLDSSLLDPFYSAYASLYQYQSEYTDDTEFVVENERLREIYIDSLLMVSTPASLNYVVNKAGADVRNGNAQDALDDLTRHIADYKSGDRNYSILASIMADVYKTLNDNENYRRYLAMSAISDLRGVVKENMAMRALATACFEDGDLERANRYLKQSFADANFYSARMRNAQSSRMLPIIDEAYQAKQKELYDRQRLYIIIVSLLAVVLVVVVWLLAKQMSKLRRAKTRATNTLADLSLLSQKLKEVNEELANANIDLKNANTVKEEYAGLFMEYCSLAISNLQHYHQQLRLLAVQGNIPTLMKRLDSTDIVTKTLHDFYEKFDEAILTIYPSFVEKFNMLLCPEGRLILKPGEKLNTELRVFALVRIGISDSEKIAQFLRCSLSTIYTYRSKVKKRALNPADFEKQLMKI